MTAIVVVARAFGARAAATPVRVSKSDRYAIRIRHASAMMARVGYFSDLRASTRQDWIDAVIEEGVPVVCAAVPALLDGVDGWPGLGLWAVYGTAAWTVWTPVAARRRDKKNL